MEIKLHKHVSIKVDLEVGEVVRVDGFGYKLDGKDCIINEIIQGSSESGILVKVDKYENYLDSDWIVKLPVQAIGSETKK